MRLKRFFQNTSGSLTVMSGLVATAVLAGAGAGIDMVRMINAKTELDAAMDSAVLSGTQYLAENRDKTTEAIAIAEKVFAAELDANALAVNTIKFKMNSKDNGLASYGNAEIGTTFLKLVGLDKLPLLTEEVDEAAVAEAGSLEPTGDLEISLMLDVTGSMCSDGNGPCQSSTKLTALKTAAKELVDAVVWEDQTKFTSKIAIVPFSTRVRVGPDAGGSAIMKKLTNLGPSFSGWRKDCVQGTSSSTSSESGGTWSCQKWATSKVTNWKLMPCVTDRFYDLGWKFELTDAAPASGAYLNAHEGTRMLDGADSSSKKATVGLGTKSSDPATNWNYSPDGACYDVAQANELLPLTNAKTTLKSKIDGLEGYGATAGVLGTAFSWYLISPEWKNVWTGQSQPKDYALLKEVNAQGKPKLRKIAILMTDGSYNTMRGWKDQDIKTLSSNAVNMCANMKAKGIEVFTVGFALDSLPASEVSTAKSTLQSCGSTIKHFYNSLNAQELQAAFRDISSNVSDSYTRLTK